MKILNFKLITTLLVICISLSGCKKNPDDEDFEINLEINYGNLTGKMVFRQYSTSGNDKIIVVDFDKKTTQALAPKDNASIYDGSVSIAPGGEKLSYSANNNSYGGYQVFSMSVSGGDYVQLTKADDVARHFNYPTWNSDGTKIFYVEAASIIGGPVYSIDPDGNNNTLVADLAVHSRICISKNQSHLLAGLQGFTGYLSGGIFKYDLQNHEMSQLAAIEDSYAYCPVYSPDEQKIAYVIRHGGNEPNPSEPFYYKIMVMNADGSEQTTVIEIPWSNHFNYTYVTWSPDGTKLAFNGTIHDPLESENIYTINLDGTGLTQITSGQWWYAGPYWVK